MATIARNATLKQVIVGADVLIGAALGALSIYIGCKLWGAHLLHLGAPIYYEGDALAHLAMIKHLMEGAWVYDSARLGAPFGSVTYDYPIPDSGTLLVLQLLGRLSGSVGFAYNAYYFAGFALDAVAAYAVMRSMRIRQSLSFAGGFIYTILPFHFWRMHHLFYTWYFTAPVFTWYALRAYNNNLGFFDARHAARRLGDAFVLLLMSCFGVYYAFFGSLAILAATLSGYLKTKSWSVVVGGITAVAIVFAGVIANVSPTLVYRQAHGTDQEVAARSPVESELYGLKVAQLLLPRTPHRSQTLGSFTQQYESSFPLVNENESVWLGFIGSFGFLSLLIVLAAPTDRLRSELKVLAVLTLAFILFCTIGGLSSLFAMLVSPMIRAWNRASVFIAFFSITGTMLLVQAALARMRPAAVGAFSMVLCAFAVWDQTVPPPWPALHTWARNYESDKAFFAKIEHTLDRGSAVYQLPYMPFPEVPPINQLGDYDQLVGYLNSTSLRWSFGGMKGRDGDLFLRQLSSRPLAEQIEVAKQRGFSGLMIDRRGYADHGQAIEAELARIIGAGPALVSPNGNQSFFVLRGASAH